MEFYHRAPYKYFDTTAFCPYNSFYPLQYLTDNNGIFFAHLLNS